MTRGLRIGLAFFAVCTVAILLACGGSVKKPDNTVGTQQSKSSSLPEFDRMDSPDTKPEKLLLPDATKEETETDRDRRAKDLERRELLRAAKPELIKKQAKEENEHRLAKSELEATRKFTFTQTLFASADENARNGKAKEADRLTAVACNECNEIATSFPTMLAARDAKEMRDGKRFPYRKLPVDPEDPKEVPKNRMPAGEHCLDLALLGDWGEPFNSIPAVVIDKGEMRHVPYQSFLAGGFELNVYGDPDSPACIEIGVSKSSSHFAEDKERSIAVLASMLGNAGDRALLKSLKRTEDLKVRVGLTFAVIAETAPEAHGYWRVCVYSKSILDVSRATPHELGSITSSRLTQSSEISPIPGGVAQPFYPTRPGTDVYVHGYTKKNGSYVAPHMRSAPGTRSGRR